MPSSSSLFTLASSYLSHASDGNRWIEFLTVTGCRNCLRQVGRVAPRAPAPTNGNAPHRVTHPTTHCVFYPSVRFFFNHAFNTRIRHKPHDRDHHENSV